MEKHSIPTAIKDLIDLKYQVAPGVWRLNETKLTKSKIHCFTCAELATEITETGIAYCGPISKNGCRPED